MLTQKDYERIKRRNSRYVYVLNSISDLESDILERKRKASIYKEKAMNREKYYPLYWEAYKRQCKSIDDLYLKMDCLYDEKLKIEEKELYDDYYCDVDCLEPMEFDLEVVIHCVLKRAGE